MSDEELEPVAWSWVLVPSHDGCEEEHFFTEGPPEEYTKDDFVSSVEHVQPLVSVQDVIEWIKALREQSSNPMIEGLIDIAALRKIEDELVDLQSNSGEEK